MSVVSFPKFIKFDEILTGISNEMDKSWMKKMSQNKIVWDSVEEIFMKQIKW